MYTKNHYESIGRCLFVVHGGIGRNIMATAVIENMKRQYPQLEINVLAGCPEVFLRNPHVKRIHNLSHPSYVYEDYVIDKKALVINVEPYQHFDYIHRQKHFVQCWCEMIGIQCETIRPKIYFNISEDEMAKDYLRKFDRRMILIQSQGGKVPERKAKKEKIIAQAGMYRRNLPEHVTQEVVDGLIDRGYMVGSVAHENQFLPKGAEQVRFPIRAIVALIPLVEMVVSIDSFLLHGAACYGEDVSVVSTWGGTDPRVLGYPWQKNLVREVCDNPMCHRPNSYLHDIEETGFMWDCPHNDLCMNFDAKTILKEIDFMLKKETDDTTETRKDDPCPKEGCACRA